MKMRSFALLAICSLSVVAARAGTIIFHTGDASRPPVGVDLWSTFTSGSVVSLTASHNEYATLGPDVYVEEILGEFTHDHAGAVPGSPPIPESGVDVATGTTSGNVYWWFEYVPDNINDVPDPSNPYYADIQARGKAYMSHVVRSDRNGGGVEAQAGVNGLLTQLLGTTACAGGGHRNDQDFYTTGSPWGFYEGPTGFSFTWNAALGKWIGKAQFLGAADLQFSSLITVSDESEGHVYISATRQLKVLRVRTPGGATFTFNTAWS